MKPDAIAVALVLLIGACGAQHNVDPYPTWALPDSWEGSPPPGVTWHAPELDLMDPQLIREGAKHGYQVGCAFDKWVFGFRSLSSDIAVTQGQSTPAGEVVVAIGAIPSGMSRLFFLGISEPGPLFPGYDAVLMWTGLDAAGTPAVGALPLAMGRALNKQQVLVTSVGPPNGGFWIAAAMVLNGVAVLNGVSGDVCWIENGVALHPGLLVTFPRELRSPVSGFRYDEAGVVHVESFSILGYLGGRKSLRIDPVTTSIVNSYAPPSALLLPTVMKASAGMTRVVIQRDGGGVADFIVETAASESGPWVNQSIVVRHDAPGPAQFLVQLNQPLQQGQYVKVTNLTALSSGPIRAVGSAEMVVFSLSALGVHRSFPGSLFVSPGTTVMVSGENLIGTDGMAAVIADPLMVLGGSPTTVHSTATELHFVVPAAATPGIKSLLLRTRESISRIEFIVL